MKNSQNDKVTICIISALRVEIIPFIKALEQKRAVKCGSIKAHEGYIGGIRIALVRGGVRKAKATRAAQALISRYPGALIVFSGTAGGMDARLNIGDTVIATESVYHDSEDSTPIESDEKALARCREALDNNPPGHQIYFGRVATGDSFINKKNRASIAEKLNPLCVDMETAAVAAVCREHGIPFLAVRSISDTEDHGGLVTFYKFARLASERSYAVVKAFVLEFTDL